MSLTYIADYIYIYILNFDNYVIKIQCGSATQAHLVVKTNLENNVKSKKPHFTKATNPKLAKAVFRHLMCSDEKEFLETMQDVRVHGTGAGFHGFIYHKDLIAFWKKNRTLIREMIKKFAEDDGRDIANLSMWSRIQFQTDIGAGLALHALTARYTKRYEAVYEQLSLVTLDFIAQTYLGVKECL